MKLQIEGQKLRVRVDEDELARLLVGEAVETTTQFADAFAIRFAVRATPGLDATLSGRAEAWQIGLPVTALREQAGRLPTREGLRYALACTASAASLDLLFDVDVRDSVRRRRSS